MAKIDPKKPIGEIVFEGVEIETGIFPTGEIEITENGTYDVTNYASANVNVAGSGEDMLQARVDATNSCAYLYYYFKGTEIPYLSRLKTDNVTKMDSMFNYCDKLDTLDVSTLKTDNVTSMDSMFAHCNLEELDLSNFNTSKVTLFEQMFEYMTNLKTLNISSFDVSQCGNFAYMFRQCQNLTMLDLSNFYTNSATYMAGMFTECYKLTSLNVSNFKTDTVTNMRTMFSYCSLLPILDLSSFNTSNVTNFSEMFYGCSTLTEIIGTLDLSKAISVNYMFRECSALTSFTLKNIKKSLQIGSGTSYGTLLDDPTIINTAMELWDLTGSTAQTLTVSTATSARLDAIYVKLITATEEMIANDPYITSKKPCEVCQSTDEGAMTLREYIVSKNWTISG